MLFISSEEISGLHADFLLRITLQLKCSNVSQHKLKSALREILPYGLKWKCSSKNSFVQQCIIPVQKSTIMIVLLLSLIKSYRLVKFLRVTGICSVTRHDDLS